MTVKEFDGTKYIYSFSCAVIDKCPVCGKVTQLHLMTEEREYYNPVKKCLSWTRAGCRVFDLACRDCLVKQQH